MVLLDAFNDRSHPLELDFSNTSFVASGQRPFFGLYNPVWEIPLVAEFAGETPLALCCRRVIINCGKIPSDAEERLSMISRRSEGDDILTTTLDCKLLLTESPAVLCKYLIRTEQDRSLSLVCWHVQGPLSPARNWANHHCNSVLSLQHGDEWLFYTIDVSKLALPTHKVVVKVAGCRGCRVCVE